ncbi:MAG: LacI family DNA-binding transcriptional regulator [Candidatus Nanopelagicales bacterium]
MGITIRDVAAAAGVSTATVSRALRGLPHVDDETRDRVRRVAQELDYVVTPSASRLASGRTGSVAVVTPFLSRWFFATVLSGVEQVLRGRDLDLLLFAVGDPTEEHRIPPERRLRSRVDGIIVISLPIEEDEAAALLTTGLPTSLIGVQAPRTPSVLIDDVAAGERAVTHLVELGHRRIGVIGGRPMPSAFAPEHDRYEGYRRALAAVGREPDPMLEAFGYFTVAGGEAAMQALLSNPDPPTAVFAMSDEMAFGAIRALTARGLRPGADVSVVGVDGHDLGDVVGLTTVAQPVPDLGRIAAETLLMQMDRRPVDLAGPVALSVPARPRVLPTRLVVRSSTAPPPHP